MRVRAAAPRARGFTLVEMLVVVLIIGIIASGVLLSVNLTGRDRDLEHESDRLLALVNYAREQAELQTRDYGLVFHDDGYQFVAYDARRGRWREVYEDESLRLRHLPDGLDMKLVVDARPVVLVPTGEVKKRNSDKSNSDKKPLSLDDLKGLKDAAEVRHKLGDDLNTDGTIADDKPVTPQVMIFSNGDLTSFELTLERSSANRSITLAEDDKGQVVVKPMLEKKT